MMLSIKSKYLKSRSLRQSWGLSHLKLRYFNPMIKWKMLLAKQTLVKNEKESKHMKNDLEDLRKEFGVLKKTIVDIAQKCETCG